MSLSSCLDDGYSYDYYETPVKKQSIPLTAASITSAVKGVNGLTYTISQQHEFDILKTLPNDLLIEREKKCQDCVKAHTATCIKQMKVDGKFQPCDKRKMLLYGYCPDFESVDVLEVEAAANGVD